MEEGIVAGGGVALLRTAKAVDVSIAALEGDEKLGAQIVRRAIESPLKQLVFNAGLEGAVVVQQVLSSKGNSGYNVATGEYEDLVKAGVVDPTKVTRIALQNAASIAGLLLTTECIITDAPEKDRGPVGRRPRRRRHGRHGLLIRFGSNRAAAKPGPATDSHNNFKARSPERAFFSMGESSCSEVGRDRRGRAVETFATDPGRAPEPSPLLRSSPASATTIQSDLSG